MPGGPPQTSSADAAIGLIRAGSGPPLRRFRDGWRALAGPPARAGAPGLCKFRASRSPPGEKNRCAAR